MDGPAGLIGGPVLAVVLEEEEVVLEEGEVDLELVAAAATVAAMQEDSLSVL